MANGTSFEIDIPVSADGIQPAVSALAAMADQLSQASVAAKAANDAFSQQSAVYASAEAAADRAAKALEKINAAADIQKQKLQAAIEAGNTSAIDKASAKLSALGERQQEASAKADQTRAALTREAEALDRLKAAAEGATKKHSQLEQAQVQLKKTSEATAKAQAKAAPVPKVNELAEAFGKLGGPLGKAGNLAFGSAEGFKKLAASLGSVAGATAGVVIVVAAAVTAIAALTAAVFKYAVTNSDAAATAQLLAEGIAGGEEEGKALNDRIKALSGSLPQTREELRKMAEELAKTGLRGQELTDALEDKATNEAVKKFGRNYAKQLNSISKLSARFEDNLQDLFRIDSSKLQAGLGKIVALFDEGTATGRAIQVVFQDLFQKLSDWLTALTPKVIAGFIQIQIWALKALIAIKPFGSTILAVAQGVAVAFGIAVAAIGLFIAYSFSLIAAVGLTIAKVVEFSSTVIEFFSKVKDFFANLSLAEIGTQIVQGLANGIMSAGPAVLSALGGVVTGAINSAKSLLGIASPSKVFAEIGGYTAEGMAVGVEDGSKQVGSALESMVTPPEAAQGQASAASGGNTFQIVVNAGSGDAKDIAAEIERVLTSLLEGDVTKLGASYA